jgi:hypothetical protein
LNSHFTSPSQSTKAAANAIRAAVEVEKNAEYVDLLGNLKLERVKGIESTTLFQLRA